VTVAKTHHWSLYADADSSEVHLTVLLQQFSYQ